MSPIGGDGQDTAPLRASSRRRLDFRGRRAAVRRASAPPVRRLAVDQLAPATVVLATCLATSPGQRGGRHQQVVGAAPCRSMGGAPAQLDEVTRGVGFRLAARAVGANDDGRTRLDEVRHVSSAGRG